MPNGDVHVANPDGKGNWQVWAVVSFANSGRSPAVEVVSTVTEYKIGPTNEAAKEAASYVPQYPPFNVGSVVPASSTSGLTAISDSQTITQKEYEAIGDGTFAVYVVGGVRYRDVFNPRIEPYETTYCYKINPTGLAFGTVNFAGKHHFGNSIK